MKPAKRLSVLRLQFFLVIGALIVLGMLGLPMWAIAAVLGIEIAVMLWQYRCPDCGAALDIRMKLDHCPGCGAALDDGNR